MDFRSDSYSLGVIAHKCFHRTHDIPLSDKRSLATYAKAVRNIDSYKFEGLENADATSFVKAFMKHNPEQRAYGINGMKKQKLMCNVNFDSVAATQLTQCRI